jgi:hypothetical protein
MHLSTYVYTNIICTVADSYVNEVMRGNSSNTTKIAKFRSSEVSAVYIIACDNPEANHKLVMYYWFVFPIMYALHRLWLAWYLVRWNLPWTDSRCFSTMRSFLPAMLRVSFECSVFRYGSSLLRLTHIYNCRIAGSYVQFSRLALETLRFNWKFCK